MDIQAVSHLTKLDLASKQKSANNKKDTEGDSQKAKSSSNKSGSVNNNYYDKMDLNKDGYVSFYEEYYYNFLNSSADDSTSKKAQQDPNEKLDSSGDKTLKHIDILV